MSEEGRGDIGEFVSSIKGESDQLLVYAEQLKLQAEELSDIGGRAATAATLCGIEQALAQISQSAKFVGKARHNAALVLGMDELIATQHKTLDKFAEEEAVAAEAECAAQEVMDQEEVAETTAGDDECDEYAEGEYYD